MTVHEMREDKNSFFAPKSYLMGMKCRAQWMDSENQPQQSA